MRKQGSQSAKSGRERKCHSSFLEWGQGVEVLCLQNFCHEAPPIGNPTTHTATSPQNCSFDNRGDSTVGRDD